MNNEGGLFGERDQYLVYWKLIKPNKHDFSRNENDQVKHTEIIISIILTFCQTYHLLVGIRFHHMVEKKGKEKLQ